MESKVSTKASTVGGGALAEGHITLIGLATNESMSDISSVSELESELGYASCENEDDSLDSCVSDGGQHRLRATRRKLQRKHRLDQLRRYAVYSNDSDTTIDDTVVNVRRLRRAAPKKEVGTAHMKAVSVKPKERISNDFRRPRNGSKGSWTDSGVSMSKTDSQPSTLGERTKSKMTSNKFTTANESNVRSSERADDLRSRMEASPVELLRGEIRRRSRSASEFTKNLNDHRREKYQGDAQAPASNGAENAAWKNMAVGLADGKQSENVGKEGGKTRYPEIIRLEDKEKSVKVKKVSSKRNSGKEVRPDAVKAKETEEGEADFENLNEKENEIIQKLLENAKEAAESKRKHSVQSHCSHSTTSEGTVDSNEHARPRRSKLQKLKDIFFRVHKSRNGGMPDLSPLKKDALGMGQCSSPSFDSYFSDDTSAQSTCTDHLCCCGYDDYDSRGLDELSHLGRVVHAKKRNVLSRFFRSISRSSDNVQVRSGRVYRARSQVSSEVPMGRKRSGSTRSLPESLKYLYLKALSKSVDNINSEKLPTFLQETGVFSPNPGYYVKRSRSSSSLAKSQFVSNFPTDISRSTDAISYCSQNVRSPPSVVRRSESLRSLNIGRNYDIATHVLQAPTTVEDVKENNNVLYHPFFEGHTTRDDCNANRSQNQDGGNCACYFKRNEDGGMGSGFISSPLSSPRSCYRGQPCVCGKDQSNFLSNSGFSNEAGKLLSPRRRASRETLCSCQENFFEANFFGGDQCARREIENTQTDRQREAPHEESPLRRTERDDSDCLVIAPLEVRVTREKHAERVKLKTARDFDSSV